MFWMESESDYSACSGCARCVTVVAECMSFRIYGKGSTGKLQCNHVHDERPKLALFGCCGHILVIDFPMPLENDHVHCLCLVRAIDCFADHQLVDYYCSIKHTSSVE